MLLYAIPIFVDASNILNHNESTCQMLLPREDGPSSSSALWKTIHCKCTNAVNDNTKILRTVRRYDIFATNNPLERKTDTPQWHHDIHEHRGNISLFS